MINNPPHYNLSPARCSCCGERIECIDITKHMDFCLGNALKYIWRYEYKGGIEDLRKARFYLDAQIARMEEECSTGHT